MASWLSISARTLIVCGIVVNFGLCIDGFVLGSTIFGWGPPFFTVTVGFAGTALSLLLALQFTKDIVDEEQMCAFLAGMVLISIQNAAVWNSLTTTTENGLDLFMELDIELTGFLGYCPLNCTNTFENVMNRYDTPKFGVSSLPYRAQMAAIVLSALNIFVFGGLLAPMLLSVFQTWKHSPDEKTLNADVPVNEEFRDNTPSHNAVQDYDKYQDSSIYSFNCSWCIFSTR